MKKYFIHFFYYLGWMKTCTLLLMILFAVPALAQTRVQASLDTNVIKIGEQFHLKLTAEANPDTKIVFPSFPDSLQKIEVLNRGKVDTTKSEDGKLMIYRQDITLTCFDSGLYVISSIPFLASPDTLYTNPLSLKVLSFAVDTSKGFRDIKAPLSMPFSFKEILPYIAIGIMIAILVAIGIWYYNKRKEKAPAEAIKPNPLQAHEIALQDLEKLQEDKLWQRGFYKEYHSQVSDIVRTYIEYRFDIPAMELTSDETLQLYKRRDIPAETFEQLTYILKLADMAKFAKVVPLATENELSIQHAFNFVMMTKPVTEDDFKEIETNEGGIIA